MTRDGRPRRLRAPTPRSDADTLRAFEETYRAGIAAGVEGFIDYRLDVPKWEFLCYLVAHKDVVLHGSNDPNIALFKPIRSGGLDHDRQGSLQAVYATSDGIWPFFFAILDRENYRGSMRNGPIWEPDESGQRTKYHCFSINAEMLKGNPWRQGVIYVLPRDTFEPMGDHGTGLSDEWASKEPVRPRAKLRVDPVDFPFLDQVEGHDDSGILRFEDLIDAFLGGCVEIRELDDGYALAYHATDAFAGSVAELIELFHRILPWTTVEIAEEPGQDTRWLRLRGPEAFKDVLADRLKKHQR